MYISLKSNELIDYLKPIPCRQVNIKGTKGIEVIFHNNHFYSISNVGVTHMETDSNLNVTLTLESVALVDSNYIKMNYFKYLPKLSEEDIKAELKKISKWCLAHDDPAIRTGVNSQIVNLLKKVK